MQNKHCFYGQVMAGENPLIKITISAGVNHLVGVLPFTRLNVWLSVLTTTPPEVVLQTDFGQRRGPPFPASLNHCCCRDLRKGLGSTIQAPAVYEMYHFLYCHCQDSPETTITWKISKFVIMWCSITGPCCNIRFSIQNIKGFVNPCFLVSDLMSLSVLHQLLCQHKIIRTFAFLATLEMWYKCLYVNRVDI